jgi:ABC-2 type transport system permease protein
MIFVSVMLSLQFLGIAVERWGKQGMPYLLRLKPLVQALPPGIAGLSLESVARSASPSGMTAALAGTLCLAGYAAVFGLILRRRLLNQYQGEELGESEAPQAAAGTAAASAASPLGSLTSRLPPPVAAILEKEFRYLVRNGPLLMTLAIPLIMVLFFSMAWNSPKQTPGFLKRSPDLMFPSSVGYALLVLMPFAFNSFAYDGRGIQTLLAAPVRFREVLLGKNLAMGTAVLAEGAAIWGLVSLLREPPHAATVVATLCMLCFAILLNLTVGNMLSLYAPRAFDFGKFRQRQSPITVFSVLGMQILIVIIAIGVFATARWLQSNWYAAGIFLALAVATLPVYSAVLDFCSGLAERRRENITAELCK